MSRPTRTLAGLTSVSLVAGLLVFGVVPSASAVDCTLAPLTADGTCTLPGDSGVTRNYTVELIGGGGGWGYYGASAGGGAINTATVSLPAGTTIDAVIGQGGKGGEDPINFYPYGGGGGGSSAITYGGTLVMEAGGGGGGSYESPSAGAGGGADGAGTDAGGGVDPEYCDVGDAGGKGGNSAGTGTGGLGGGEDIQDCIDEG